MPRPRQGEAAAQGSPTAPALLTPTPACDDGDDDPTPAQTEGPYFTSNSPSRTSLVEAGMPGTLLTISGRVLTTACQGARAGKAGSAGRSRRRLQRRGLPIARPSIHRRVRQLLASDDRPRSLPGPPAPHPREGPGAERALLATQVYFPGEPRNASDGIYSQELLLAIEDAGASLAGTFNFVRA